MKRSTLLFPVLLPFFLLTLSNSVYAKDSVTDYVWQGLFTDAFNHAKKKGDSPKDLEALKELIEGAESLKKHKWGAARYQFRKMSEFPRFGLMAKHWICFTYVVSGQKIGAEDCYEEEGIRYTDFRTQLTKAADALQANPENTVKEVYLFRAEKDDRSCFEARRTRSIISEPKTQPLDQTHPKADSDQEHTNIFYGSGTGSGNLVGTHCSSPGARGYVSNYRVMCRKTTVSRQYKTCSGPVTCGSIGIAFTQSKRWYISGSDRGQHSCSSCR